MTIDEERRQQEDRDWQWMQCDLAKKARAEFRFAIKNTELSAADVLALVGKVNAQPVRRLPAGQAKFVRLVMDTGWTPTGPIPVFLAVIEYSPLGWPDDRKPAESAELNVLFKEATQEIA